MKYCKHLKRRKNKPYCCLLKKEITYLYCRGCINKEYKNALKNQNIVQKKKKHHTKKRITVSKETYIAVIQRDNYCCRLIDNSPCDGWLELHHILYRSERKDLINNIDNCIMLCMKHHKLVHSNKKKWQPILLDMNK